uniref:Patatin n=4 Tax=Aegilops tauschii subsp. strangulata TaxID=200361 RepID=A0A453DST0_AEGTS
AAGHASSGRGRAEKQRAPDPDERGAACPQPWRVVVVGEPQVASALLREHRYSAQHRRRWRARDHPRHHPRLPRGEAPGARRARGEDLGLLRRDRRDEHGRAGDRYAQRARRRGPSALRRQGHQQVLPRPLPEYLPSSQQRALQSLMRSMMGPKYNGEYLHSVVKELLGDTRVGDTLNNVVIPTFDIKLLQPTIFSTYNAMKDKSKNALLSDVCISTSAAPTYLPGHHFRTEQEDGKVREFNLIDGGVAANNPTLLAMTDVSKQILMGNPDFFPIKPADYGKFMILSLGTGTAKIEEKFDAAECSKWGLLGWLYNRGATPIIDSFSQAQVLTLWTSTPLCSFRRFTARSATSGSKTTSSRARRPPSTCQRRRTSTGSSTLARHCSRGRCAR